MNFERERIFNIDAICNERCVLPNLAQLLDEEGRPQVIRRAPTPLTSYVDEGRTYVYLVYALRKCHRVLALTSASDVDRTRSTASSAKSSRIYAIPQSYPGWFQVASENAQATEPIIMLTIEEVIASKATQFMICDTLTAFQLTRTTTRKRSFGSDPEPQFHPAEISSGLVLTVGAVLVDIRDNERSGFCCCSRSDAEQRTSDQACGSKTTEILYLQCFDVDGRHLLLPLFTRGRFYAVAYVEAAEEDNEARVKELSSRCVHQIKDILRDNCLPLVVTLVCGNVPVGETDALFIGCRLKLLSRREEKSLVACQVGNGLKPAFVEFPSDCGVLFQMTAIWNKIKSEKIVVDALRFCSKNIEAYKTEIQPVINGDKAIEEWNNFPAETTEVIDFSGNNKIISVLPDMMTYAMIHKATPSRVSHIEINEQIEQQLLERNGSFSVRKHPHPVGNQFTDPVPEPLHTNLEETKDMMYPLKIDTSCIDGAIEDPTEQELLTSIDFLDRKIQNLNSAQNISENIHEPILNDASSDSLAYDNEGYLVPLEERADRTSKLIPAEYSLNFDKSVNRKQVNLGESDVQLVVPSSSTKNDLYDEQILLETVKTDSVRKTPFARMRAVTLRSGFDRKQLDLFLEDSVSEFRRNQLADLERIKTIVTTDDVTEKVNFNNNSTFSRARRRSEPCSNTLFSTIPQLEFPLTREQVDVYLEKLFDIEGVYDDGENSESGLGTSRRSVYHDYADLVLSTSDEKNRMPAGELSTWSVEEVAMALRYIGMNASIINKFSKEQIDGKLLADINNALLREGFPELNAWNRQKLVKFVHGWRPKRMTPAEISVVS